MTPRLTLVTPPVAVATAADARAQIRDASLSDAYLGSLVAAATAPLDGPWGLLGRAIGAQVWDAAYHGSTWWTDGRILPLPLRALLGIVSVTARALDGTTAVMDPAAYRAILTGDGPGGLALNPGYAWPALSADEGAVVVRLRAGYETVPAPIRQAILLQAGRLHALTGDLSIRSEVVEGMGAITRGYSSGQADAIDRAIDSLLAPYRVPVV